MTQFDVLNVPLKDKNLIEASAGTGKTYSIAILILRMIVSHSDINSIKDILVVTFTNAAANELQERIRLFIQKAYTYLLSGTCDDVTIKSIIDKEVENNSNEQILMSLKRSLSLMDESNITTIHSFVQKTLQEFPFDTYQTFQIELMPKTDEWIDEIIYLFWRKYIIHISPEILELMDDLNGIKETAKKFFKNAIINKKYWLPDELKSYTPQQYVDEHLSGKNEQLNQRLEELREQWEKEKDIILQKLAEKKIPRKPENKIRDIDSFDILLNNFIDRYLEKVKTPKFIYAAEGYFFDELMEWVHSKFELQQSVQNYISLLLQQLYLEYVPLYHKRIQESNAQTFDGMISSLRKRVLEKDAERLLNALREKYKAVFIDEFQDTDIDQFIIFKEIFFTNPDSIVFIIGDPKQSIYAFRGADIDCYLQAKELVDNVYSMNWNFRSSADMIHALNGFYLSMDKKEAFGYTEEDRNFIEYEEVSAQKKIELRQNGEPVSEVLTFHSFKNQDSVVENLINAVTYLLSYENSFTFYNQDTNDERIVKPSDIGILVETNKLGNLIKNRLLKIGVPAVQLFDQKILSTNETIQLVFLLEAFLEPNIESIKKALYFSFLQEIPSYFFRNKEVLLNETILISYFSKYNEYALENKAYQALYSFIEDFGVRIYFSENEKYAHILSHIEQLLQLINFYQYKKNATTEEVINWLKNNYYHIIDDGDEFTTILESDEDAVKIVTIHKSKGLEYPITCIVGLDKKDDVKDKLLEFKLENDDTVYFSDIIYLDEKLVNQKLRLEQQETRRLIYVALTRAVYRCMHFISEGSRFAGSELKSILSKVYNIDTPYLKVFSDNDKDIRLDTLYPLRLDTVKNEITEASFHEKSIETFYSHHVMLSYSSLATHPEKYLPTEEISFENESESELNEFVFKMLPKGAYFGTIMHEFFQEIDFKEFDDNSNNSFKKWKRLPALKNLEFILKENYSEVKIEEFLKHIFTARLHAKYHDDKFVLSDIPKDKMLHELEFNFGLDVENSDEIKAILMELDAFADFHESKLNGLMNGFIDLIFEKNGKYYILDWKTNHLGTAIEYYSQERLFDAMSQNNYHLQYYIYTVALHLYLQERIPDYEFEKHFGGVFYLFIRGCRAGEDSGVFYNRPKKEIINRLCELMTKKSTF